MEGHGIVKGKRILLAEDQRIVRDTIKLLLHLDQHVVTEVENGVEALACALKDEFDLVITDFDMPEMQGDELAVQLKRLASPRPIIMVTAYAVTPDPATNPVDLVLTKPFGFEELRQAMASVLAESYRTAPLASSAAPRY
jgi:CheY-like chemotaxis protein